MSAVTSEDRLRLLQARVSALEAENRTLREALEGQGRSPTNPVVSSGKSHAEQLFAFLEDLPLIAFLQARDFTIVHANRRFRELFGEPGSTPCYVLTENRQTPCNRADCSIQEVFETGRPCERDMPLADGSTCRVYNYPYVAEDGTLFVFELGFDVTEQKRARDALRESESRVRDLINTTSDLVWETDAEGVYTYVSACAHTLVGYPVEALIGQSFFSFVEPSEVERVRGFFCTCAASREPFHFWEVTVVREDGRRATVEVSGVPFLGADGSLLGYRGMLRDITGRKATENALRESESRYKLLAENLIDVIWACDLGMRVTYVSPSVVKLLGYTPEEIMAIPLSDLIAPQTLEVANKILSEEVARERECQGSSSPRMMELEQSRKDGSRVWTEAKAKLMLDAAGRVVGVAGVTRDITERWAAGFALREREERLRMVLEATSHGVWDLNLATGETNSSPSYAHMLGFDPEELAQIGDGWMGLIHPDDSERVKAILDAHVRGLTEQFYAEFQTRTKPGAWKWILSRGRVVERNAKNEPLIVVGTHTDISDRRRAEQALRRAQAELELRVEERTAELARANAVLWTEVGERRKAELALRESEAKLRALLDAIPDHILQLDEDGLILDSQSPVSGLGTAANPLVGTYIAEYLPPALADEFMQRVRDAIVANTIQVVDFSVSTGEEVRDHEARVVVCGAGRAMAIIRDVTQHRRLERQVLEISSREERRIGQDLHDGLGQQLTGIAFLTKVLARRLADRAVPEKEDAEHVASLLNETISQTRALARGLSPIGLDAHGVTTAFSGLADSVSRLFSIHCVLEEGASVHIEDETAATHLYRIAQEAVHNAVRHGHAQRVTIRLDQNENNVVLQVKDDGEGFDPSASASGGMGLHIMRYRSNMIGATFSLDSTPGSGTVVTVSMRSSS